jgi:hypothetical protein
VTNSTVPSRFLHVSGPPPERVRSYPELFVESANALGGVCPYTHGSPCFVPGSAHNVTNLSRASHVPGDSWRPQPARAATNRPGPNSDGRKRHGARAPATRNRPAPYRSLGQSTVTFAVDWSVLPPNFTFAVKAYSPLNSSAEGPVSELALIRGS